MKSHSGAAGPETQGRATLAGLAAIGLWGALALLTTIAGAVPPFQMVAITFTLGATIGFLAILLRGRSIGTALRWPLPVWSVGVAGLFGFHALFFAALQLAPPAEANLVNYLWPLLIVLLSAPVSGMRLRWWHIGGAALGFVGIAVLGLSRSGSQFDGTHIAGYLCALGSAFAWALYSVISRRFGEVSTDAVAGFCAATAALAIPCHLAFETTHWPANATSWGAVLAMGLGPTGAAFYLWDHAVKRGDIRVLGGLAYLAPILSTALLLLFGGVAWSETLAISTALVVGGAVLAARETLWPDPP